jgi:hypothetical protein
MMAELRVQANVTSQKTFYVVCPHCQGSKLSQLSELPPNSPNPFQYKCTCGVSFQVLLNYRKTLRKRVKLMGTITMPSEPKFGEPICEVLDISDQGMLIQWMRSLSDYVKAISPGQLFTARIILDDPRRSRLEVPCIVRNTRQDKRRIMVGAEFKELDESQRQVMRFYMMSGALELQV